MNLPLEVIMPLIFAFALLAILLGTTIDSIRIHRKLNKMLFLLGADTHNKDNISSKGGKG